MNVPTIGKFIGLTDLGIRLVDRSRTERSVQKLLGAIIARPCIGSQGVDVCIKLEIVIGTSGKDEYSYTQEYNIAHVLSAPDFRKLIKASKIQKELQGQLADHGSFFLGKQMMDIAHLGRRELNQKFTELTNELRAISIHVHGVLFSHVTRPNPNQFFTPKFGPNFVATQAIQVKDSVAWDSDWIGEAFT